MTVAELREYPPRRPYPLRRACAGAATGSCEGHPRLGQTAGRAIQLVTMCSASRVTATCATATGFECFRLRVFRRSFRYGCNGSPADDDEGRIHEGGGLA